MYDDTFSAPVAMAYPNLVAAKENFSHLTSVSHSQSNINVLNGKNQIPAVSVIQSEVLNNFHADLHLTDHAEISNPGELVLWSSQLERNLDGDTPIGSSCPISYFEVHNQFMDGMPISAHSLANRFTSGCDPNKNLKGKETSTSAAHSGEVLKTFWNDYSDILQSSFGTSVNDGYDFHGIPAQFSESMKSMDQNEWISAQNTSMSSDSTSGSSRYSSQLSSGLSICENVVPSRTIIPEHCSVMSGSDLSGHSLPERRLGLVRNSCNTNNLSSSSGYKPVQLSQLLSRSRFFSEMQEILAELASYALGNCGQLTYFSSGTKAGENDPCFPSKLAGRSYKVMDPDNLPDGNDFMLQAQEVETKKKLLHLLQMVDKRYNQCLDEIHKVISAFHAVTELDPLHAHFALQTISVLYRSLRERISNYILTMGTHLNEGGRREEKSFETSFIQKQWALQELKRKDQCQWRPHRGLPERSVSVLRAWMFQNFLHPYPKDAEKHLLAVRSGLTRSQVSNWFINARVRLWKPMIDKMYSEMNTRKVCQNGEETDSQQRNFVCC